MRQILVICQQFFLFFIYCILCQTFVRIVKSMTLVNLIVQILNIIKIFFNHLVNIPLNLLAGVGKFYAVVIAFCLDMLQATIYTKILEGAKLSDKLKFLIKIFPDEKIIEQKPFFNKFRKLQYFGIFLLASLPVYTGGICAASVLRYISKNLNKKKSFIALILGSLIGCIVWVVGINYLFIIISSILKIIEK